MLRTIYAVIRYGLSAAGLHRRVSATEAMIDRRRASAAELVAEIEVLLASLERMRRGFDASYEHTKTLLDNASLEARRLSTALDAARDERKIDREILIPGLVSANEMFVKRWEAETAAMSARIAFQTPGRDNGE